MTNVEAKTISVAVYGACHAIAMQEIIASSAIDRSKIKIFPVQSCYAIDEENFANLVSNIPKLDLLVYQTVSAAYRDGQFATEKFSILDNSETESVAIQYYHFETYWPFMAQAANGLGAPPFTYIDYHLAAMIAKNMSDAEIADRLQNEVCFDPFLEEAVDWAIKGLVDRERKSLPASTSRHVLISDFVRNNFETKILGHTYNHPTSSVYDYILNAILDKTDALKGFIPKLDSYGVDPHTSIRFPVPDFVRRQLKLNPEEGRCLLHLDERIEVLDYISKSRSHFLKEGAERIFGAIEMLSVERPWFKGLLRF